MASSSTTTKSNQFNQGTSTNFGTSSGQGTSIGGFANKGLENFQNSLMSNINQGMNQSNQPLYGQAQQAQFLNNLNSLANSSINSLQGQMARMGAGNSGALAQGATDIGLNRSSQFGNYLANVPLMNRQAQLQSAQTYGGLGNSLMSVAPRTQFSSQSGTQQGNQFNQGTGTGYSKQTQDPSIMSDIGQGLGIAGAAMGMPMFGNMFGGGGTPMPAGNSNFNNLMNPYSGMSGAGSPFGAQVGGGLGAGAPGWLPNPFSLPGYQGGNG